MLRVNLQHFYMRVYHAGLLSPQVSEEYFLTGRS